MKDNVYLMIFLMVGYVLKTLITVKAFTNYYIMLTILLITPLLGAIIILPFNEISPSGHIQIKRIALISTIMTFVFSMVL